MAQDQPDWTQSAQLTGAVKVTHVTVIDQVTTITGVTTAKVTNKATTVLATGSAVDYLGEINATTSVVITNSVGNTFTTTKSYSAIAVTRTGGSLKLVAASVYDRTATGAGRFPPRFAGAIGPRIFNGPHLQGIIPCANEPGDNIQVDAFYTTTPKPTILRIYGITMLPSLKIRSDGRNYPIGVFAATEFKAGSGTVTLVPAPASPLRILIKSITGAASYVGTTLGAMAIKGKINGSDVPLANARMPNKSGATIDYQPEGGQLLDVATAVTMNLNYAQTSAFVTVTYDLVV